MDSQSNRLIEQKLSASALKKEVQVDFDKKDGRLLFEETSFTPSHKIHAAALTADEKAIVATCADNVIRVYDLNGVVQHARGGVSIKMANAQVLTHATGSVIYGDAESSFTVALTHDLNPTHIPFRISWLRALSQDRFVAQLWGTKALHIFDAKFKQLAILPDIAKKALQIEMVNDCLVIFELASSKKDLKIKSFWFDHKNLNFTKCRDVLRGDKVKFPVMKGFGSQHLTKLKPWPKHGRLIFTAQVGASSDTQPLLKTCILDAGNTNMCYEQLNIATVVALPSERTQLISYPVVSTKTVEMKGMDDGVRPVIWDRGDDKKTDLLDKNHEPLDGVSAASGMLVQFNKEKNTIRIIRNARLEREFVPFAKPQEKTPVKAIAQIKKSREEQNEQAQATLDSRDDADETVMRKSFGFGFRYLR